MKKLNLVMKLAEKFRVAAPLIVQSPMAGGITSPELVAAVSNHNALGSFATGYLSTEQVRTGITQIKALTNKPFAVNVFIPNQPIIDERQITNFNLVLNQFREKLGLSIQTDMPHFSLPQDNIEEIIQEVIEQKVPVVSFTFGNLSEQMIQKLKAHDVYLMGTATSVSEAVILKNTGIDAIVLQGTEAGGHRGSFFRDSCLPLASLISEVSQHIIDIPLVAAGGIMTGEDISKVLHCGADGVQMGTAFLITKESTAKLAYKQALVAMKGLAFHSTESTCFYSGKPARGLITDFVREMKNESLPLGIPPYPIPNLLTTPIRKEAQKQGHIEMMSLWAGEGVPRIREMDMPAAELLSQLRTELRNTLIGQDKAEFEQHKTKLI